MSEKLRAVLQEVVNSEKKEPQERDLLSFTFNGENFLVTISNVTGLQTVGTSKVEIKIYEKQEAAEKVFHGEIFGVLSKSSGEDNYKMQTISAFNVNSDFIGEDEIDKTGKHIRGLIRETMKQLLVSGIISEWSSAGLLSEGGNKMYESLAKDPELTVSQQAGMKNSDGSQTYFYTVTANNEVSS